MAFVAQRFSEWWFQTISKNMSQNGFIFPKIGVKIKIFETTTQVGT